MVFTPFAASPQLGLLGTTGPGGTVRARTIYAGGSGTGFTSVPAGALYTIQPGSTVTFAQTSALSPGAATLYIELWGS